MISLNRTLWLFVAACLFAMLGVCRADEGTAGGAPQVTQSLFIVPPTDDKGFYAAEYQPVYEDLHRYFVLASPPDTEVFPLETSMNDTRRQAEYAPGGAIKVTQELLDRSVKFRGTSHLLRLVCTSTETEWKITATLEVIGGESAQKDITVPKGHDFVAAYEIAHWLAQEMKLKSEAGAEEVFNQKLFGETANSRADEAFAKPMESSSLGGWKKILSDNPGNQSVMGFHCEALLFENPTDAIAQYAKATPETSTSYWNLQRAKMALETGNEQRFYNEMDAMVSKNGTVLEPMRWFLWYSVKDCRDQYHAVMEKWYSNARKTPGNLAWRASGERQTAWGWRGGGYSNTVSEEGWRKFEEHLVVAEKHFLQALKDGGSFPWVCRDLIDIYGSRGEVDKMMAILDQCTKEYPDCRDIWESVLHFARPRWSGNSEVGVQLIDRAMKSRPENGDFGNLAWDYHRREIKYEFGNMGWPDNAKAFRDAQPDRIRQIMEGAARLKKYEGTKGYALFCYICAYFQENEAIALALKENPEVYLLAEADFPPDSYSFTINAIIQALEKNRQWDHLSKAALMAHERDHDIRRRKEANKQNDEVLVFNHKGWSVMYMIVGNLMSGNTKDAAALLRKHEFDMHSTHRDRADMAFAIKNIDLKKLQVRSRTMHNTGKDSYSVLIHALTLAHEDKKDEAIKHISDMKITKDDEPDGIYQVGWETLESLVGTVPVPKEPKVKDPPPGEGWIPVVK